MFLHTIIAIAKLEKRTDIYISTLRNHIEAMGELIIFWI